MSATYLLLGLGGLAGTFARFFIGAWAHPHGQGFPRGTLLINLLGSLALGFVLRHSRFSVDTAPALRTGLAVGFCGAFTTMSTFAFDSLRLLETRAWAAAALYVGTTVTGCLLAVWAGTLLASRLSA